MSERSPPQQAQALKYHEADEYTFIYKCPWKNCTVLGAYILIFIIVLRLVWVLQRNKANRRLGRWMDGQTDRQICGKEWLT